MSDDRLIENTVNDPTLPKTPVVIHGRSYDLCFDYGALAEAETSINRELFAQGRKDFVSLLEALPLPNLSNTRIVFAAAVRTFHPEIRFDAALKMVDLGNFLIIHKALVDAWEAAISVGGAEADPPLAGTPTGR